MKFQGFIGPAYTLDSVNVDCQRAVNIFPEKIESGTGKEGQLYYYRSTPGFESVFSVGSGPIRMIYADRPVQNSYNPPNRIFVVSGNELFYAIFSSGSWAPTKIGNLLTSSGPVYCVSKNEKYITQAMFTDGQAAYHWVRTYAPDSPEDTEFNVWEGDEDSGVPFPTHIAWIDGFNIVNNKNTDQFYVSGYGQYSFSALDYASSEGDPDIILALLAVNRDLWIINQRSIEVWSNVGNADFPFQRVQGGFIDKGCVAPHSVAKVDTTVFWLGRDEHGQGIVYAAKGLNPQRVSTHAIEQAIQSYSDISAATAYTYQSGGHYFYVLNFTEATWVFDLSTGLWHERAFTGEDGILTRHRADTCTFIPALNLHLIGDFQTGDVYALKDSVKTDDGAPITRLRVAPHISGGGKLMFYKSFMLDMQVGVGLPSGQGSDPQAMLDWSNDGGHTWSSESWASLGKTIGGIGEYTKRVIWNRLGSARDRVFRLKITDPVDVVIMGAEVDVEAGVR